MIVDVHVHTSNHPMVGLHTADASIDAIERQAEELGIERLLVIATYFPYKGTGVPNLEMLRRIEGRDRFRLIGSLDVMHHFEEGLTELKELARARKLAGIKLFPGYQNFRVADPKIFDLYRLAREYGLPITIHGGELHHCCSRERRDHSDLKCGNAFCWIDRSQDLARPGAFVEVAKQFSDVTFVIAHAANPFFSELGLLMEMCPNVMTDVSGQFQSGTTEDTLPYRVQVRDALRLLLQSNNGNDRLMFASDFPIQSFADTIALVELLGLDPDVKEKILWRNANRVYCLGLEA
ncbi:hypothetical protein A3C09_02185 [Candidatus Uhrbacteria bacterium RIFCSPHIGHO2_02_FULL_47_44]|uniref:Amidohydrolase-related domain-containing protein n=1 Tax=Candidatus Uhrbacteria bacterium RIFCSPLOWO2_02_FULL_48_18 TaxID=1802408 RepID=A0A1F7VBP0_9BACT|nr:MAG: hypothetical protein A2839_04635 [Candidatus Uhrbacteria bacterium RIFCSPHIGHO2_01_FULL_47_10]OGL70488.1 MAG: hypothetical protein A3C09_02185 [Candidatus Uhrbacteria bacterium RIFCSPHIGHO2_02_FULL_47_44]OGL82289.1 MAG: hypothetical protein A3B20_00870 [Candidatus Uhrbacteria bacterium RIFCSPLOWO2_01_FULL_47_17]OGL87936.1 MAG: hypothetical protein A3I41_02400 [Candidatus Uhrbacteria bacterium RIFCSPLOWO2_02_FULL_48_18]OGL91721.1 MAG: hypothetical protein A3H12_00195 [Candidatus Uhrbacte